MFKMFGQLFSTLSRTISAVDHLVAAGELQAELLHETSKDDVEDKRAARKAKREEAAKLLED